MPTTTGWIQHRPDAFQWPGETADTRNQQLGEAYTTFLADLYAAYRLDGAAITEAVAELLLPA